MEVKIRSLSVAVSDCHPPSDLNVNLFVFFSAICFNQFTEKKCSPQPNKRILNQLHSEATRKDLIKLGANFKDAAYLPRNK